MSPPRLNVLKVSSLLPNFAESTKSDTPLLGKVCGLQERKIIFDPENQVVVKGRVICFSTVVDGAHGGREERSGQGLS